MRLNGLLDCSCACVSVDEETEGSVWSALGLLVGHQMRGENISDGGSLPAVLHWGEEAYLGKATNQSYRQKYTKIACTSNVNKTLALSLC